MTLSAAKKSPAIQRSPRGAVIEQRTEKSPASNIYKIIPMIYYSIKAAFDYITDAN